MGPVHILLHFQLLSIFTFFGAGFVLLFIGLFIVLSALVSSVETALFSISPVEAEILQNSADKKEKQIGQLLQNPKHLLASLVVANNFFNISIVVLSAYLTAKTIDIYVHPILAFFIQTIAITFLLLLACDIIPKVYATGHSLKVSKRLLLFVYVIRALFYPFASILTLSTLFMDKYIFRQKQVLSAADLSDALEITSSEISQTHKKILRDIIQLANKDVKEIMKPRIDIIALNDTLKYTELLKKAVECGFSRIPIYHASIDSITGLLFTKDLLAHSDKDDTFNWKYLQHKAFFVPESKKINDLLEDFQKKRMHLAIVVDEFGSTSGIVTLEDIIEEILGEINDEFDEENIVYSKLDEHNFVFEGKITLGDFCRKANIDESVFQEKKGGSDTLAGFIIELCGRIPEKYEKIDFSHVTFTIEAADKRTVQRVKVTIKDTVPEQVSS
ncbi:MAG TPA: gliding motility-associated protein GldE [Bacteroidia bacterium]|nr:gliding motility-associated protein GldE [Bacteroidia bacterium]